MLVRLALLVSLAGAGSSCATPCAMLAERFCACEQAQEQNRRACETSRDNTQRARAESVARHTGIDPQHVCRQALRFFRCPSADAVNE